MDMMDGFMGKLVDRYGGELHDDPALIKLQSELNKMVFISAITNYSEETDISPSYSALRCRLLNNHASSGRRRYHCLLVEIEI